MQFFVTCHFQKLVVFLAVKMAAYEELITHIYTLFCPFYTIGKTSLGYETLLEKIKAVCAWNSFKSYMGVNINLIPTVISLAHHSHTFTAELRSQYILSCAGSYKVREVMRVILSSIKSRQLSMCWSLFWSITRQFGVLALHHWYFVRKLVLPPITNFQCYARSSGLLCFCSTRNTSQFGCQIIVLHNCVKRAVKTCISKIYRTTMAEIFTGVPVIYKINLQMMLQYLICTAQIEKLHYSFTCPVGLATAHYI